MPKANILHCRTKSLSVQNAFPSRLLWTMFTLISGVIAGGMCWKIAIEEFQRHPTAGEVKLRSEQELDPPTTEQILFEMAQLSFHLEEFLGQPIPRNAIEINLFASSESFQKFVTRKYPELMERSALYVHGSPRQSSQILLYQHPDYLADLRHEWTHAALHRLFPGIPLWLDEGLAEYFEAPDDCRLTHPDNLEKFRKQLAAGWQPNLKRLEQKTLLSEFQSEEYHESWAWTHFLRHGPPPAAQVFKEFMIASQSDGSESRLSELLESHFAQPEVDLITHIEEWSRRYPRKDQK